MPTIRKRNPRTGKVTETQVTREEALRMIEADVQNAGKRKKQELDELGLTQLARSFYDELIAHNVPLPYFDDIKMFEYTFAESVGRKWLFDFAWPEYKVAVEIEGIFYQGNAKSRHTTGVGYSGDCEKYNTAQLLGWIVLRFTSTMIQGTTKKKRVKGFDESVPVPPTAIPTLVAALDYRNRTV